MSRLGEIGGLHYVYWHFGKSNFRSLYVDVTIHNEPDNKDGLFFQMYQGKINGAGFYFGLQTDIQKPRVGSTGKGIIFSRWGTRDLANVRFVPDGWSQSVGYEGDFIGIRRNYEWEARHSYGLELSFMESDAVGDWYGVWIEDLSEPSGKDFLGALRFPFVKFLGWFKVDGGIEDNGITWTELYQKAIQQTSIPNWHVSVDKIYAGASKPVSATSRYSEISNTDIYYEKETKKIHFLMGPETVRAHESGRLF